MAHVVEHLPTSMTPLVQNFKSQRSGGAGSGKRYSSWSCGAGPQFPQERARQALVGRMPPLPPVGPGNFASSSINRKRQRQLSWVSGALITVLFLNLTRLTKDPQFHITGTAPLEAPGIIKDRASNRIEPCDILDP
jgi:hypothetical protein